jgi:hypothetical protein
LATTAIRLGRPWDPASFDDFNDARPHQGIGQKIPSGPPESPAVGGTIKETPILVGLHHDYRRAA